MLKLSLEELFLLGEEDIIRILAEEWGFNDEPIRVFGKLYLSLNGFVYMENFRSCRTGNLITYPIPVRHQSIFIGPPGQDDFDQSKIYAVFVELSNQHERLKSKNPFALKIKVGTKPIELINTNLTAEIPFILNDGNKMIEKSFFEYYSNLYANEKQKILDEISKINQLLLKNNNALVTLKEDIYKKNKELNDVCIKCKRGEDRMNEIISKLKNYADKLLKYKLIEYIDYDKILGNQIENKIIGLNFNDVFKNDFNKAIKYLQAVIYEKDNYIFSESLLRDFFALLRMNEIIIFAGDSGSGKSSLCKEFAKFVGGICHIIPVKPNWTSKEDLLGYYNPLDHKYFKSDFLEALLKAKDDPDRLHIICLDEMNIARVEYYFADFLSILEERNDYPKITLFYDNNTDDKFFKIRNYMELIDKHLSKSNIDSLSDILMNDDLAKDFRRYFNNENLFDIHCRLRNEIKMSINDVNEISFPKNVRIVGTVNIDETTYYLSPKILDRVNIIKFSNLLNSEQDDTVDSINEFISQNKLFDSPIIFNSEIFGERTPYPPLDLKSDIYIFYKELHDTYLKHLGVNIGARVIRQAILYYKEMKTIFDESDEQILNNFIRHKILPKINIDGDIIIRDNNATEILQSLCTYLAETINSIDGISCVNEINHMIEMSKINDNRLSYWS